jgi:hypothetical protein
MAKKRAKRGRAAAQFAYQSFLFLVFVFSSLSFKKFLQQFFSAVQPK